MSFAYQLIASLGLSFLVAMITMPIALKMANKIGWYDAIDERKIPTLDTPNIGGVGIFIASTAGIVFFYLLNAFVFKQSLVPFTRALPLLGALFILHVTGLVDDFANLRARYKFLLQLTAAVLLAATGYGFTSIEIPWSGITIHLGIAGYIITILWLTGTSNAINFVDGMDGLSGGSAAIASLTYGIIFTIIGSYTSALISFTIFGALVGFLIFNWPPAKIFMGDSGALYLGFALGALPFLEHSGSSSLFVVSVLVSVLLFPVLDTISAIVRRTRRGIPIIVPDKEHTHHKLLDFGIKERDILALLYTLVALPCGTVIVWAATGVDGFFWLVVATWVVMVVFFVVLDVKYHGKERRLRRPVSAGPQPE